MDNITIFKVIGSASLLISLLMNPQLTIAIVVSIIVFLMIGVGFKNSTDDFDIEEQLSIAKMSEEEIMEKLTFSFMVGAMFIMLIVSIYNIVILF